MRLFKRRDSVTPTPPINNIKLPFLARYKGKRKLLLGVAIFLLIIGTLAVVMTALVPKTSEEEVRKATPKPEATEKASLINGVVLPVADYNRRPVAAMIENSPAARPQAGLIEADVVYEAVTEGGITRFMGIFASKFPEKAGPIRSARSYFIEYLSEYDAMYAHAGGSPTALSRIGEYGIKAYPHNNDSYTRIPQAGVSSEHTLFANLSKIWKFGQEKKGWSASNDGIKPWLFKTPAAVPVVPAAGSSFVSPIINFSSAQFKVEWKFDPTTNLYSREMGGSAHKDRTTGEQIKARTVVTMNVTHSANKPYSTGKESEWNMATTGSGAANVFQDGTKTVASWKKASRTERTRFYNDAGSEITLNAGQIWIEIVPQEGSVQ